ncbi:MAG: Hsp33 family molecular chaperone HslO [Succinivibrio sp.]|nr:Hsp33 family molecular chaperone HslO [Succinivibrio sp.]
MSENKDSVMRFLFDNHAVRGEIVQLNQSCISLLENKNYPKSISKLMLELSAAAVLVATTLKDGSEIMVQIKGGTAAPLKYALINIRQDLSFYGSAALKEERTVDDEASLLSLAGHDGIIVLSVFPKDGEKWQGVVELDPSSVSASLENYFLNSQQLPTRFFMLSDPDRNLCGGLLLQIIPNQKDNLESLEHLNVLTSTLTAQELFSLNKHEILRRLFAKEQVRVFAEQFVSYRCICSKDRCQRALEGLRRQELEALIADGGTEMTCQHCGKTYRFSKEELQDFFLKVSQ